MVADTVQGILQQYLEEHKRKSVKPFQLAGSTASSSSVKEAA